MRFLLLSLIPAFSTAMAINSYGTDIFDENPTLNGWDTLFDDTGLLEPETETYTSSQPQEEYQDLTIIPPSSEECLNLVDEEPTFNTFQTAFTPPLSVSAPANQSPNNPSIDDTFCSASNGKHLICCPETEPRMMYIPPASDFYLGSNQCRRASDYGVDFARDYCKCCKEDALGLAINQPLVSSCDACIGDLCNSPQLKFSASEFGLFGRQ